MTYVGNDPVESYHPVMLRQTIKLTVIFNPSKMPPQSSALNDSLTHWLHTLVYLRGGACGSTVILPDQSQWAVQSYSIDMDATQIPRIHLELVGIRPIPIPGIEEWVPTRLEIGTVDPYSVVQLTRKQIFDTLEKLIERGQATTQQMVIYETTGQVSPTLMDKIKAYILKQEVKQKIERKDAFWKD